MTLNTIYSLVTPKVISWILSLEAQTRIINHLSDISTWRLNRHLKLKRSRTKHCFYSSHGGFSTETGNTNLPMPHAKTLEFSLLPSHTWYLTHHKSLVNSLPSDFTQNLSIFHFLSPSPKFKRLFLLHYCNSRTGSQFLLSPRITPPVYSHSTKSDLITV